MMVDILELRNDLAEGIRRICREVNYCASAEEEMKENVDGGSSNHARCVSENSELSDDEQ